MKFELAPSRLIDIALLFAHSLAALMITLTPFPLWLKYVLIGALLASAVVYVRRNRARLSIELDADDLCLLQIDEGAVQEYRVSVRSFVASYLVILRLENGAGRAQYVIIPPDRLDPDTFRRLRVFLRWGLRTA